MKKRGILSTLLVVVMLVICMSVFVGCGGNEEKNLEKITFLLDWTPNTNHTGLFVAKELGYFEEAGLDVNIIQPGIAGQSLQVAAGTAQYGIDMQDQMVFNESKEVGATAIASIIQHNTSGILSPKDRNVVSVKDMEGKKYATWNMPVEQTIVKSLMKQEGADPNKLIMEPKFAQNIVQEFANPKGVDCVWSFAGWDKVILDKNNVENNFIEFKNIEGLDFYTPVIVANNKYMANNPEKVKAFINAVAKGYDYAIKNPKKAADILIKLNPELAENKEIIYASQEYLANEYKSDAPYWGYIDQTRWDSFYALICGYGNKDLPTKVTPGYGFTNEYLPGFKSAK